MPVKKTVKAIPSARTATRSSLRGPIDQSLMQGLVGYNIRRAELHMRQAFDRGVGQSGLRPSEFSILVLVDSNALVTQTDLGNTLSIKRPNMVVLIEGLERRGLIVRAEHEHDGRMHTLRLTAKGEKVLAEARRLSQEAEFRATRCWTHNERAKVIALLRQLYEQG